MAVLHAKISQQIYVSLNKNYWRPHSKNDWVILSTLGLRNWLRNHFNFTLQSLYRKSSLTWTFLLHLPVAQIGIKMHGYRKYLDNFCNVNAWKNSCNNGNSITSWSQDLLFVYTPEAGLYQFFLNFDISDWFYLQKCRYRFATSVLRAFKQTNAATKSTAAAHRRYTTAGHSTLSSHRISKFRLD